MVVETTRSTAVEAAIQIFLRYGFRKASMEEVAQAAGISRQGLYLHFPTKEALFHAVLERVIADKLQQVRAALMRADASIEQRLLEAFEPMHGFTLEEVGKENTLDLVEAATAHEAELVARMKREFVGAVIAALEDSGVARRWVKHDLSARQLAEQLFITAHGLKGTAETRAQFRASMKTAIRMVVKGA